MSDLVKSLTVAGPAFQECVAWFIYGYHLEEARSNPRSHSALLLREAAETVLDTTHFPPAEGLPDRHRNAARRGAGHRMAEVEGRPHPAPGGLAKHDARRDRRGKSPRGTGGMK